MVKDYVIVKFDDLDMSKMSLLPCRSDGFGGQSMTIMYGGKKLYVTYEGRHCSRGVVRWGNGRNPSYTVTVRLEDGDKYDDKVSELDSYFGYVFGNMWSGIARGETITLLDFKIRINGGCTETKFFLDGFSGDFSNVAAEDCIPLGSKIGILAYWDRVSIRYDYGAVIRPKALQVRILRVPDLLGDYYVDLPVLDVCDDGWC